MTYVGRDGSLLEKPWFLIICHRLDGVDRELSRMRLAKGVMWTSNDVDNSRLVFSEAQVAGHHPWCDKHLKQRPFISDGLADAIRNAGLTGLRLERMESI